METNYQNPLHLAIIMEGQLEADRPDALLCVTSNPGEKDEHYNCLVLRVYSDKNDLNSFKGYVTFRYNEVKYRKKTEVLPEFSSIEIRDGQFNPFTPQRKIHFCLRKYGNDYPTDFANLAVQASATPGDQTANLLQAVGQTALKKAYQLLLDLVDGK